MANVFTNIVDSALGWFTKGGALSAAVKWGLNSLFDVADSKESKSFTQPAPPQTDDNIRLTQYGNVIPRVSGAQLITCREPFWKGELVAEPFQTEQGVKYNYFMDLAYIICVGEIDGIYRAWENGELRAQYGTAQDKLPGTLYVGSETQTADPTISAVEGAINTPAFRGISYIVLNRHWLGTEVQLPTFKFEVVKGDPL